MHRNKVRQYASTIAVQGTILALGIGSGVLSGRLLGPGGRGELAVITLWPSALALLVSFGVNQGIVYQIGKARFSVSETWSAALLIGMIQSVLVLAAGYFLLPHVLRGHAPDVVHLAVWMLAGTPALILSGYPVNIFQGARNLGHFNVLRTLAPATYSLGLLALWLGGVATLRNVAAVQISGYALALLAGGFLLRATFRPKLAACRGAARDLVRYGACAQLTNLTTYFNQRCDQLLLSLLVPSAALGQYAVGVTLAGAVGFLPQAAGLVTFAHATSENGEDARTTIARSFRLSLLWLLAASGILFFTAPFLVRLAFGKEFDDASLVCRILLPGMVALGLNNVLYSAANALGRPALPSLAEMTGLIITGAGLLTLVPRYGYVAAAVISTAAYLASLTVMLFLASTNFRLGLVSLLFGQAKHIPITVESAA